ncbi:hypothetical protein [Streptomyces sp. NPDC055036]
MRAVGSVQSEDSRSAGLVALTDVGTYEDAAAIPDAHLREVAKDLVDSIRETYLSELLETRDQINVLISQLENA